MSSDARDLVVASLRTDTDRYVLIEPSGGTETCFCNLPVGDYRLTYLSDWSRRSVAQVTIRADEITNVVISGTRP